MITSKMSHLKKSRKIYLLLLCVTLFCLFVETQIANSAPPKGIAVRTFSQIDLEENPQCWSVQVSSTSVQYTNTCPTSFIVNVTLTHLDGTTQETFLIAPNGKVVFQNGGANVVHIIREQ